MKKLTITLLLLLLSFAITGNAQGRDKGGMNARMAQSGLKVGGLLPAIDLYDADGNKVALRSLKGNHSVIVFGCLT